MVLNRMDRIFLCFCLTSFFFFPFSISAHLLILGFLPCFLPSSANVLSSEGEADHRGLVCTQIIFYHGNPRLFHYAALWMIKLVLISWAFPCFFCSWYLKEILKIVCHREEPIGKRDIMHGKSFLQLSMGFGLFHAYKSVLFIYN